MQMVGVIAFVGDRGANLEAIDKIVSKGGMDLGAQPASGPTQALGIRPPFCLRAPAAC